MNIKLRTLCGYGRPSTAWRLLLDISRQLEPVHNAGLAYGNISPDSIDIGSDGKFVLDTSSANEQKGSPETDIWYLGAAVFELLMGIPVFGGKGNAVQTGSTPVPRFSTRYGEELSCLVKDCLNYDPKMRPDAGTISKVSLKCLSECAKTDSGRRSGNLSSENVQPDLNYWPEQMN